MVTSACGWRAALRLLRPTLLRLELSPGETPAANPRPPTTPKMAAASYRYKNTGQSLLFPLLPAIPRCCQLSQHPGRFNARNNCNAKGLHSAHAAPVSSPPSFRPWCESEMI